MVRLRHIGWRREAPTSGRPYAREAMYAWLFVIAGSRLSDGCALRNHQEVEVGQGQTHGHAGELDCGRWPGSIAVVVHGTRHVVVDDAIAGIERGRADHELAARDAVVGGETA